MEASRRRRSPVIASTARFGDRLCSGRGIRPVASQGPVGWAHASWGQPNRVGQNYLLGMRIRSISNALLKVASRPGSTGAYYEARLIEADQ
jgi:hypothetical protein